MPTVNDREAGPNAGDVDAIPAPGVWLVNGVVAGAVAPGDRGLAYGDGLFETMAARGGRVARLDYHFERLVDGCARLGIAGPDLDLVAAEMDARVGGLERAVVKLVVTRGPAGRGYKPPARAEPTRILGIFPWPERDPAHYTAGIVLRTSNIIVGENERLAGLKHLNRLEQVLASMALDPDADEGLQMRASGHVVGGISSNVFAVRDGRVSTPAIATCGVRGVMRRVVIEACARAGLPLAEADLRAADLESADELFMTSTIAGLLPVRELDGRTFSIGPVARQLRQRIEADG